MNLTSVKILFCIIAISYILSKLNSLLRVKYSTKGFNKEVLIFNHTFLEIQKRMNEFCEYSNGELEKLVEFCQKNKSIPIFYWPVYLTILLSIFGGTHLLVVFRIIPIDSYHVSYSVIGFGLISFLYLSDMAGYKKYIFKKKELDNQYMMQFEKYKLLADAHNKYMHIPFLNPNDSVVDQEKGFLFHFNQTYKGISKERSCQHLLLVGPTGVGKSTRFIIPSMFNSDSDSLIINDESSELYTLVFDPKSYVSEDLRSKFQERKIVILNPLDLNKSIQWNPLSQIKNYEDCSRLAYSIIHTNNTNNADSQFWNDQATLLLTVALGTCFKLSPNEEITFSKVKSLLSKDREMILALIDDLNDLDLLEDYKLGYGGADSRVAASILNTVTSSMQLYFKDNMKQITSKSTFSFHELRDSNCALFLTMNVSDRDEYKPYFTLFLNECLAYLSKNKEGKFIKCLLDEFGSSFGNIKKFPTYIATLRKNKVALFLAVQSIDQIKKYYPHNYKTIVSNCLTKLILGGSEHDDCTYFSKLCGEFSYPVGKESLNDGSNINTSNKSTSESDSSGSGFSIEIKKQTLISSSEIRELDVDKGLCIIGNEKPFLFESRPYYFQETKIK